MPSLNAQTFSLPTPGQRDALTNAAHPGYFIVGPGSAIVRQEAAVAFSAVAPRHTFVWMAGGGFLIYAGIALTAAVVPWPADEDASDWPPPFREPLMRAMTHEQLAAQFRRRQASPPEPEELFDLPEALR